MRNGLDNSQNIIFLHKIIKNTCIFPPNWTTIICYQLFEKSFKKDLIQGSNIVYNINVK